MKTIFKYVLPRPLKENTRLDLPVNSKILSVINQNGNICIYALVDPDVNTMEVWNIKLIGTGHNAEETINYNFVGTVKVEYLVLHTFAKKL